MRLALLMLALAILMLGPLPAHAQSEEPGHPRSPASSEAPAYPFIDTAFESGGVTIPARLLLPRTPGPHPVLVVASGTQSTPRVHPALHRFWAPYLDAGVAILMFDDRGTGDTPGQFDEHALVEDVAADVLAAVRHIKTLPAVRADRVGVIGLSRGGWTGPNAATRAPGEVAVMVLISAPAMSRIEQNIWNNTNQLEARGFDAQERAEIKALREVVWPYYATGEGFEAARAAWAAASQRPWFSRLNLPAQPAAPEALNGPGFRFYRNALYDPAEDLAALNMPVLAVFGADDRIVEPGRSAQLMSEIFSRSGHPDATLVTLPGAGHNIRRSRNGVESPPMSWDYPPAYPALVVDWLRRRLFD